MTNLATPPVTQYCAIPHTIEHSELLRQKSFEGVPVVPTEKIIWCRSIPQPSIKKGLGPRVKKKLIKELLMPGKKSIDPRFFKLDLRKEKYSDYPDGWLTILKQSDNVNHACFKLGDDVWLDRKDYLRDDEVLCELVDRTEWFMVFGTVVIELADNVFEPGKIINDFPTPDGKLIINQVNPYNNCLTFSPTEIVKIWKVKTLTGRKVY